MKKLNYTIIALLITLFASLIKSNLSFAQSDEDETINTDETIITSEPTPPMNIEGGTIIDTSEEINTTDN